MIRSLIGPLFNRVLFITVVLAAAGMAQPARTGRTSNPLIVDRIDATKLAVLKGNTRPEALTATDAGMVPSGFAMDHMLLTMRRSASAQKALESAIANLHNPKSSSFHKWLSAAQFGEQYGASEQDLNTVTAWLTAQGFSVNSVYPNGMTIDFSGTAGQVKSAFHTEIHYLDVNGTQHVANTSDPQIPAALQPAVAGIASMHDFKPHHMRKAHANYTYTYQGSTYQAITPADLATIYDFNPLFQAGITGQGQTIAVIEDATLYSSSDWDTFRSTFGLSQYSSGSLSIVNPAPATGGANCSAPGLAGGDDGETTLDAEWASAAAPGATIMVAACADTRSTFGGLIALQNLVNSANPPGVISISYGECEAGNGAASNATYLAIYEQAVAEGISIYASAGDEGAASCDAGSSTATHGIGVSAFASTPYNVAVGGTDFGDNYAGTASTYWNTTNSATYGSALSYVPEIPWNDSCAGSLLSTYLGYASPYGSSGFCAASAAQRNGLVQVAAGSGGPSSCATGVPSQSGVVGGSCQGYTKPSWQAGLNGISNDGVRDIPDLSVFAGTGVWGHYYVMCWSDTRNGGAPCTGDPSGWAGAGGTSFGAPILAGLQALINQKTGAYQGNPNYIYYALAASMPAAFHSVTAGDISVDCTGSVSCFGATASSGPPTRGFGGGPGRSTADGALSLSTAAYSPAYPAAAGWNFTSGIGTIDANQIVTNWNPNQ